MKQKQKQVYYIDKINKAFYLRNNIDISLIKELNTCVSNDLRCNQIKKIINEKADKLIILNDTLSKSNKTYNNNYINSELIKQIKSFNKLILLGHQILI
tara:strand:+ start:159 stop:455 length:297 start_codon:yes stop_codon:yes gene_type:complete